ncbi:MAG: hypothetical protein ACYDD1_05455 [Caulobacteraceae bacterium]
MIFNPLKTLAAVAEGVTIAEDVLAKTMVFVKIAEDSTTTGAEKLAAVKTAMEAYITATYPTLTVPFDTIWTELSAVITGVVSIYKALGVFVSTIAAKV